jgi:hypothetical protein
MPLCLSLGVWQSISLPWPAALFQARRQAGRFKGKTPLLRLCKLFFSESGSAFALSSVNASERRGWAAKQSSLHPQ